MKVFFLSAIPIAAAIAVQAQPTGGPRGVDKTLITSANQDHVMGAAALHKLANDYYNWRNENDPVSSSNAGLHTWDDELADFSPAKISERARHVRALLDKVRAMKIDTWPKDEKIDARFEKGVLTIRVPKPADMPRQARRIDVRTV